MFKILQHLLPITVDVLDDEFDDDDDGNGEEHACRVQEFSAKDDAENDGNGVKVQGFSDERRVDKIVVDLRENQVEPQGLQGHDGRLRGSQQRAEGRSDRRAKDGHEFTDARYNGKNRSIGKTAETEIQEYHGRCDEADDQLAADI